MLCVRIVNAPHLKIRKLYARDKRRDATASSALELLFPTVVETVCYS